MDWQPIETANTDGPDIIVWNGARVTVAWYSEDDGGWQTSIDAPDYADNTLNPQPTHWMPLPAAPV